MRRGNRSIETFTMSTVDLFACAMGAFMLLMIILAQYYQKTSFDLVEAEKKSQQLVRLRLEAESAMNKAVEAREQAEELARQNAAEAESMRQEAAAAQARARDAVAKLERAKQEANQRMNGLEEARRIAEERARALERELDEAHRLAFLGIVTQARSLIFVVDMSGSMKQYTSITQRAVAQMVDPMDAGYKLAMLGFHTESSSDNTPILRFWPEPFPDMTTMNASGIAGAKSAIHAWNAEFRGQTPTRAALIKALEYPAEAIILFTDGNPNDASRNAIVEEITRLNTDRKEIHTVAVGNYTKDAEFVTFLFQLADRNNGQFVGLSSLGASH